MSPDRRVVLAATLAGLAVALVVTLLQASTYRAAGTLVLTREGRAPGDDPTLSPAAAAAVELLESRAVAESVVANLRLDDSPGELLDRIDADAEAQSSLLRVSVDGDDAQSARRTAQEVAEVFSVLYNTRFRPSVSVSIWEAPAAEEGRVAPRVVRNLALGALAGALAGLALGALGRRPRRPVEAVVAAPAREPEPEPEREPPRASEAPEAPEPPSPFVRPESGAWTVADVEALVAAHGGDFPAQREELDAYLASLRDVADADGRLPAGVQGLVEDVFAGPIEAARTAAERDR
jgi:capsular polysaccharide biosynthesis protein